MGERLRLSTSQSDLSTVLDLFEQPFDFDGFNVAAPGQDLSQVKSEVCPGSFIII